MTGIEAKRAGKKRPKGNKITYLGRQLEIGSPEHHLLMKRAIRAKLEQNHDVLCKLLANGETKITHLVVRKDGILAPDSKSIPGEIFSQILMDLRQEFRADTWKVSG